MTSPATSGVAVPDARGTGIRIWRILGFVSLGLALVCALSVFVLLFVALYDGLHAPLVLTGLATAVLAVFGMAAMLAVYVQQSAQRNDLSDALTLAGHPGVDVRRLQAGRPVPSPQGVELRLRRAKDDGGRPWLLVDAFAYAPRPGF